VRNTLLFLVSLAAGYLIGTIRIRRDDYDHLTTATRELADDVGLQSAAGAVSGRASELLADARRRLR